MMHRYFRALPAIVFSALVSSAGGACAASFTYTALNAAGAPTANPFAANSQGQVVGLISPRGGVEIGFVWYAGSLTMVNGADQFDSINDAGIAVGLSSDDKTGFVSYDTATGLATNVPIPFCKNGNHAFCLGIAINKSGEVGGYFAAGTKAVTGFVWANGTAQKILPPNQTQSQVIALNKVGDTLVMSGDNGYYNPFLNHKKKFTPIAYPGAVETFPFFVADNGTVGGEYYTGATDFGFVLADGAYVDYAPTGATSSRVTGIGPAGQIVGTFDDANGDTHGFENVNGTYYQIDVPNSTYTTIVGITASGMIFGDYRDSQGLYGYVGTCPKKVVCTQ